MIKSITLQNFQSHKNTTVDFCDGVNAIVGLSDSGKTAILRAINWVVANKPTGEAFQSSWGGETIVTLTLGDNVVVTRGRSFTTNYYMINEVEFKAFGLGVPLEVQQVLNFGDVNIEKQMDTPYLLGSSPGEVAQVLNKIVDLDNIDASISSIRKDKMRADGDLKTEKSRYVSTCEELKQFDYLEAMEECVYAAEELSSHIQQTIEKVKQIRLLLNSVVIEQRHINKAIDGISIEPHVLSVQQKYDSLKTAYRKMVALNQLLDQYDKIRKKIKETVLITSAESDVDRCIELMNNIKRQKQKKRTISSLLDDIDKNDKKRTQKMSSIKMLEQKYFKLMPDSCPLCDSPM